MICSLDIFIRFDTIPWMAVLHFVELPHVIFPYYLSELCWPMSVSGTHCFFSWVQKDSNCFDVVSWCLSCIFKWWLAHELTGMPLKGIKKNLFTVLLYVKGISLIKLFCCHINFTAWDHRTAAACRSWRVWMRPVSVPKQEHIHFHYMCDSSTVLMYYVFFMLSPLWCLAQGQMDFFSSAS